MVPTRAAPKRDVVTVTRIDRLARSTFDLFGIVKRIVDATLWCDRTFSPRTTGGSTQKFCCTGHRQQFWIAALPAAAAPITIRTLRSPSTASTARKLRFACDDYAGALANFRKNGAQILEERVSNGRHVCWVAGPDGAQMELIEKV
jgi:hypothetical protein